MFTLFRNLYERLFAPSKREEPQEMLEIVINSSNRSQCIKIHKMDVLNISEELKEIVVVPTAEKIDMSGMFKSKVAYR